MKAIFGIIIFLFTCAVNPDYLLAQENDSSHTVDELLSLDKNSLDYFEKSLNFFDSSDFEKLHYRERVKLISSFLQNPETRKNDSLFYFYKFNFARYQSDLGKYTKSASILDTVILSTGINNNWITHAEALALRGYIYKRLNNNEKSISDFELLLMKAIQKNDLHYEYTASVYIGDYYRKIGKSAESIPHYYRADEIAEELNDFVKLDRTKAKIGRMLVAADEISEAIQYFQLSLKYSELNRDSMRIHEMRETIADFSPDYSYEEVIEVIKDYIRFLKKLVLKKDLSKSYDLAAKYYYRMKDFESSFDYSKIALDYALEGKQQTVIIFSYYRMGLIEFNRGNLESAMANYKLAEKFFNPQERPGYGDFLYEGMGDCYSAMGKHELARASYKKSKEAKELSIKLDTKKKLAMDFTRYSINKQKKEEFDLQKAKTEALLDERNYMILSLFGITLTILIVLFFVSKLSKERRENLIIQNKKNALIQKQKDELDNLNKMKDRFFSVMAHDLRGPVGNMMRLSKLILLKSKQREMDEDIEIGSLLSESSKNINRLLQSLLVWGKAQMKVALPVKANYRIAPRISEIIRLYEENISTKHIQLSRQIDGDHEINVDEVMVDSVFRNLIHNAIKFTPAEGKIDLSSEKMNGNIKITIKDDGAGIEKRIIDNIYAKNVVGEDDYQNRSGLGLILAKEFVDMNDGEMIIDSEVGVGTEITVLFPAY